MNRTAVSLLIILVAFGSLSPMLGMAQEESESTLTGEVRFDSTLDGNGTVHAVAINESGERYYIDVNETNQQFKTQIPDGNYTLKVCYSGRDANNSREFALETRDIDVQGDTDLDPIRMTRIKVTSTTLEKTSGPGDVGNLTTGVDVVGGVMLVGIHENGTNFSRSPVELSDFGVTDETEFKITLNLTSFDPEALYWMARDSQWTVEEMPTADTTQVTVTTNPTSAAIAFSNGSRTLPVGSLATRQKSPDDFQWPENQQAGADRDQAVYFALADLSTLPPGAENNFVGMSVTTNAQVFDSPTFRNGTLEFWVAAPSTTTTGEQHTGFYHVKIPDTQLQDWGLEDQILSNDSFDVRFKGKPVDFRVEGRDDGVKIFVDNITYSEGSAQIEPSTQATTGGGTGTSTTVGLPVVGDVPIVWIASLVVAALFIAVGLYYRHRDEETVYMGNW